MRKNHIIGVAILSLAIISAVFVFGAVVDNKDIPFTYFDYDDSLKNQKKIIVSFRNDDISDNSDAEFEEKVLSIFWKYKIKQTFAFIPIIAEKEKLHHDKKSKIIELLKRWNKEKKIELAIHGYEHKKNEFSLGEFKGLPYDRQLEKIVNGKFIVDQTIKTDINIFVPPWNQADEETINACKTAGIKIFSGYLGEKESNEIIYVNSNSVLFKPRKHYYSKEYDIPVFEEVIRQAEKGVGTIFLVVIYHSRTDFRKEADFRYLENLLESLQSIPNIEFSTIGEIAKKYHEGLKTLNQAGLNIKESKYAIHFAKPYLIFLRKGLQIVGLSTSIDKLYDEAFVQYFKGQYSTVGKLCEMVVKKSKRLVNIGRIIIGFVYSLGFCLMVYFSRYKIVIYSKQFCYLLSLYIIVPIILPLLTMNIIEPISKIRINEFNKASLYCVASLLIFNLFIYSINYKKNETN